MNLNALCSDIIKLIIEECDILSLLRLERVCKRLRNLLNDKFWEDKINKTLHGFF